MTKQETYEYLDERKIQYEIVNHPAVFNMEEVEQLHMPYPDASGKNILVRDDKKANFYMITVRANKRVDLKTFRSAHGTRRLSFCSPEDMMELLGLAPGSVTPLALLNDSARSVHLYIDSSFMGTIIGVHPNDNTATIFLQTKDLLSIIREHGNPVDVFDII